MAKVISFGIQKGGVGKSTTSGITAYLLSELGYKVLAIDMDSQGNLTQFLSGNDDLTDYEGKTIREAMIQKDIRDYIQPLKENLDFVPADDYLVLISEYNNLKMLQKAIEPVRDHYDFIIIDTPPALSVECRNAIVASDYVVCMFETSKFCYNAIPRFLDAVHSARDNMTPNLKVAGILATLNDGRRSDMKDLIDAVQYEYKDLLFNTVIKRKAATGRLPAMGFMENKERKQAVKQYESFLKELIERVGD